MKPHIIFWSGLAEVFQSRHAIVCYAQHRVGQSSRQQSREGSLQRNIYTAFFSRLEEKEYSPSSINPLRSLEAQTYNNYVKSMVRDVIVPSRGANLLRESYSGIGDIVWTGKAYIGRPTALQGGTPFLRRGTETCAQFRFIAARGKFSRALPAQHVTWPEQQLLVLPASHVHSCVSFQTCTDIY